MDAGSGRALAHSAKLRLTAMYMLAHFSVGLMFGCKGPALLAMVDQLQLHGGTSVNDDQARNIALTAVGTANGAASLGLMVGSLLMGPVVDRVVAWHRWLSAAWLFSGCCCVGYALFTTPMQLLVTSCFHGVSIYQHHPGRCL